MGLTLPEISSSPYADRRGWIKAFGVIEILMALACLLMAVFVSLFFVKDSSMAQGPGQSPLAGIAVAGGFYMVLAAFFFAGGIGSFRQKNWARLLMMVGSLIWMAFGAIGVVAVLVLLPKIFETRASAPPGAEHLVLAIAISMQVFFGVLLPLAFLIFYTRKSVKATFLARAAMPAANEAISQTSVQ